MRSPMVRTTGWFDSFVADCVLHDCQIRLSLRRRMQVWIRPLVFGMWFQVANKDSDLDTDLENAQAYQDMLNWHLL